MEKITKDMTIAEAFNANPNIAGVLMSIGMHCLGCALASGETIEEAAAVHAVDLDELLEKLNACEE